MKRKSTNSKQQLSKIKIDATGKPNKKLIQPVIVTSHPAFKIGGVYFEPALFPDDKTIKELKLTDAEIQEYLFYISFSATVKDKNSNDYEIELVDLHNRTIEYFSKKKQGAIDLVKDNYILIAKREANSNNDKLGDLNTIIFN